MNVWVGGDVGVLVAVAVDVGVCVLIAPIVATNERPCPWLILYEVPLTP